MTAPMIDLDDATTRELLAGVSRWARRNGWQRTHVAHCYRAGDGRTEVTWEPARGFVGVFKAAYRGDPDPWISAVTVTSARQAIDVLVALDVLPVYFCTQYATGRAASIVAAWSVMARC